jgi:methylmalonyl-CoA/ethylmalonyl-CoA epimerase
MTESSAMNTVVQVGIIVRDIEKSLDAYCEIFKLQQRPGVTQVDPVEKSKMEYKGAPSGALAKLAFVPMGQVTIELIQPVGGPSTWQEFLDANGEGVHHIAFHVKGTEQVVRFLNGKDIPLVQQGQYTGGMYSYLDSAPQLGVILELLENFE